MKRNTASILAGCWVLGFFVYGETALGQCNFNADKADSDCEQVSVADCDLVTLSDCTRGEFTIPCNGTYELKASVSCAGGGCLSCQSCVRLYKLDGATEILVESVESNNPNGHGCPNTCSQSKNVSLDSANDYVIYVCKLQCPSTLDPSCEDICSTSCTAYGCLRIGTGTCP